MANLRTNNLSGEQGQNAYRGAVNFGGYVDGNSSDFLSVADHDDFDMGTGDFTFECWLVVVSHAGTTSPNYNDFCASRTYGAGGILIQIANDGEFRLIFPTGGGYTILKGGSSMYNTSGMTDWMHVAVVRSSGTVKGYLNGIEQVSGSVGLSVDFSLGGFCDIGDGYGSDDNDYPFRGAISNLRILKGRALYTSEFTPPTSELTIIKDTILLCCQDSDNPYQEATGKTITGSGNHASVGFNKTQPKVIPPYGVDAGNTFGGPIQQSSQGYMYFPTGRTEERGRGRVVIAGGVGDSPQTPYMTRIDFFNITTTGNTLLFGDLSFGSRTPKGMVSSTTRAVYAGGMGPSSEVATNSMSFITIATQGNGTDYGDLTAAGRQSEGCSNNTRGIYFSGQNDSPSPGTNNNIIDFITTASTGNATDFGDQTNGRDGGGACQSTTRGIYAGGDPSPYVNIIDFITIATAGNAQDFGDLSFARTGSTGCSNSVRGLFMSGRVAPTNYNTIEFITIATTGNSEDFGDLSYVRIQASAAANKTRGVLIGGNPGSSPYNFTEMSQVNIDSTGNATNFGDCFAARTRASVSDSHGGLS